jgi:D-galactarolactone isomerase
MSDGEMPRRTFLVRAGLAAVSASLIARSRDTGAQTLVPNSSGTASPTLQAPPNTCDCHHHIYDAARFPPPTASSNPMVSQARAEEYQLLRKRLHTTRSVIVTPAPYVTDNRVTLDAIARFGPAARGVAVVRPEVTDAELKALDRGGIRGIRFSLSPSAAVLNPVTTIDMVEPLSKRIASLGWHVQVNFAPEGIAAAEALWTRLPTPIVFDHIARIPGHAGTSHPAYAVVRRLIDKGRTWVKLSVSNGTSDDGPPTYADLARLGQEFVKAAPERLVWGSNWPHPGETEKPDDAILFDLMARWAPDERTRRRILVDNPATLYGFGRSL